MPVASQRLRVAGTDPGTSSLDVLVLVDGAVAGQCRFTPAELQAAPALARRVEQLGLGPGDYHGCLVELGSAFTACLVLRNGRVVDGVGGTSGPFGWGSGGAWDGEAAYLLSPLEKRDLFRGGVTSA